MDPRAGRFDQNLRSLMSELEQFATQIPAVGGRPGDLARNARIVLRPVSLDRDSRVAVNGVDFLQAVAERTGYEY